MINQINEYRKEAHEEPLKVDPRLEKSAMKKACDMRDKHYFDHKAPDGQYSWHLFAESGYDYYAAGENLAQGYKNDRAVLTAFMNSPEHKANILDADFKDIGIAHCGIYVVQHFGELK